MGGARTRAVKWGGINPLLKNVRYEMPGPTARIIHSIHSSRFLGWGLGTPLVFALFGLASAPLPFKVALVFMGFVYPTLMTRVTLRAESPLQVVYVGALFEAAVLGVFAEIVCLEPLVVAVFFTVAVFNAGSVHGAKHAVLAAFVASLTAGLLAGQLRAVQSVEVPPVLSGVLVLFLLGYVTFATQFTYGVIRRYQRVTETLREQNHRIEGLHRHLVDSIAEPYVSDAEILGLIGQELDEKQLEAYRERVRMRQRLEDLGRRAGVVSHDMRNLLLPVTLSAELLEDMLEDPEEREIVEGILTAGRRAADMLDQLVRSSKDAPKAEKTCDVSSVTREVVDLLQPRARGTSMSISCEVEGPADQSEARIDAEALHRVLTNLGVNALQALEGEGQVNLKVRRLDGPECKQLLMTEADAGIQIVVRDDGVGMAPDTVRQVFEPYFTTRTETGGTGLGLSTSFALISDAGGTLKVMSEEGEGTSFLVSLPVAGKRSAPA